MAVRFAVFDRWGNQIGSLTDVLSAEWAEELNGEDTLSVEALWPLAKGQRIVWRDAWGDWHEHTVAAVAQSHESGGPVVHAATCENSMSELYGDYIMDKRPANQSALYALTEAIRGSRWAVGTVDVAGTNSATFYRESCRECVQKVVETWGGELWATVQVSGCSVTSRKLNLSRRGSDNGRRFEWGADMEGIRRTFDADDVVTALYGFGKGEEVGDGYGRGIDFSSVNGGRMYVADADALAIWGRPTASGGKAHVYGKAEFPDCDDPAELLRLTKEELERRKEPRVSYEASVNVFAAYGYDFANVGIGDDVALIDRAFSPEVRVKGRVTRIVRDLLDEGRATDITIGNVVEDAAGLLASQYAELRSLGSRATSWDVAAYTPSAYIQQVMDGLNKEFDEGASYIYQSPEQGIIIGSVPLDPVTGRPSRTPATAIQLKGGGFRIANKVKANGDWNWRTFGTGDGFTADEVNAGQIQGGANYWNLGTGDLLFKQGRIADALGRSEWNLTDGTLVTRYMEADRMKATNMEATGKFSCGTAAQLMTMQGGMIEGTENGERYGFVDFSAHVRDVDTGAMMNGLQLQSDGIVRISAPRVGTAASKDTAVTSTTGFTGSIRQPLVATLTEGSDGLKWRYGTFELRFINGLMVGYSLVS